MENISLDTPFRRSALDSMGTHTLAEAFAALKDKGMIRLLTPGDDCELSELIGGFQAALRRDQVPTIGQVVAAWYWARTRQIESDWIADESMTNRSYAARKAAVARLAFRPASR